MISVRATETTALEHHDNKDTNCHLLHVSSSNGSACSVLQSGLEGKFAGISMRSSTEASMSTTNPLRKATQAAVQTTAVRVSVHTDLRRVSGSEVQDKAVDQ